MATANGTHGEVRFRGMKIAKVTSISIDIQRQTLETTGIGDTDDEYAYGKRTTSGSGTLLYKTDDGATSSLISRILEDGEQVDDLEIILHKGTGKTISGPVLIRSQGIGVNVNDNTALNIGFVINGKPTYSL